MSQGTRVAEKYLGRNARGPFNTRMLFPEKPSHWDGRWIRGPFPKQRALFFLLRRGVARGGGIVWQGGKGCCKTTTGAIADFFVHHVVPEWWGCTTVVGRESYPALSMTTWRDYADMLNRIPSRFVKSVTKPSANSMGVVEWAAGGYTLFISLSDSKTWSSGNFGFAWVDEGHLQDEAIVGALSERLRQDRSPQTMLVTTNPAGKGAWHHRWANPQSKLKLPNWYWLQSSMYENPALDPAYVARMEARHPPGTSSHRRWVLGESAMLDGAAFEMFDPDPDRRIHVVPEFTIPEDWPRGRGLDWGVDNPCVVTWGAQSPDGTVFVYRTHQASGRPALWHAERILEAEDGETISWVPADPEIFRKVHDMETGVGFQSTADKFRRAGLRVVPADNNRKRGLEVVLDLLAVDDRKSHPITGELGSPKLIFLATESNADTIHCFETLQMRPEPSTRSSDSPDDVRKKDDHWYDAVRYLVCEMQTRTDLKSIPGRKAPAGWLGKRRIHGNRKSGVRYGAGTS